MEIVKARKWSRVKLGSRKIGTIYYCDLDNKKSKLYFVTRRTTSHVMKKIFKGSVGISIAVLNKIETNHNVEDIILLFENINKTEYYLTTTKDWRESPLERAYGADIQKFIPIDKLRENQIKVQQGIELEVKKMPDVEEGFREATSGDVVKFEKEGDSVQGTYVGYEESKQYPNSYAVRVKNGEGIKTVFTSGIVLDLIKTNSIVAGTEIKIVFKGKKKTSDGKREYNDYKVYYK